MQGGLGENSGHLAVSSDYVKPETKNLIQCHCEPDAVRRGNPVLPQAKQTPLGVLMAVH